MGMYCVERGALGLCMNKGDGNESASEEKMQVRRKRGNRKRR